MTALQEHEHISDLVKQEEPRYRSREALPMTEGETYQFGEIVALNQGKITKVNLSAEDEAGEAYGLMLQDFSASETGKALVLIQQAVVNLNAVVWPLQADGKKPTTEQMAKLERDLEKYGITMREGY